MRCRKYGFYISMKTTVLWGQNRKNRPRFLFAARKRN